MRCRRRLPPDTSQMPAARIFAQGSDPVDLRRSAPNDLWSLELLAWLSLQGLLRQADRLLEENRTFLVLDRPRTPLQCIFQQIKHFYQMNQSRNRNSRVMSQFLHFKPNFIVCFFIFLIIRIPIIVVFVQILIWAPTHSFFKDSGTIPEYKKGHKATKARCPVVRLHGPLVMDAALYGISWSKGLKLNWKQGVGAQFL